MIIRSVFLDPTIINYIQFIINTTAILSSFFLGRSYERQKSAIKKNKKEDTYKE